jgi:mRNA interferase MazF
VKAPLRGEVYMVDLGLAAKVRPCLVVSISLEEADRSLVTVVPHTMSLRQSRFEITAASPRFLKPGAFDVQGIVTVPTVRLMNRLGSLPIRCAPWRKASATGSVSTLRHNPLLQQRGASLRGYSPTIQRQNRTMVGARATRRSRGIMPGQVSARDGSGGEPERW